MYRPNERIRIGRVERCPTDASAATAVHVVVLSFIDAAAATLPSDELDSIREDFEAGEFAIALSQAAAALVNAGRSIDSDLLQSALAAGFPEYVERWLNRL